MSYSLCLLTASLLTGQQPAPDAAPMSASSTQIIRVEVSDEPAPRTAPLTPAAANPYRYPMYSTQILQVAGTEQAAPAPQPGLLGRIRNFFSGRREEPMNIQPAVTPTAQPPMPTKVTTMRPAIEMSAKELEKVGHDKDYAWITGKLSRVAGGQWVLHYAGPYEVDRYEGCVMLAPNPNLAKFHDGDLVCAIGKVLPTRAPRPQAGAVYEASEINLIEAGKR